jgi:hypothetical protein
MLKGIFKILNDNHPSLQRSKRSIVLRGGRNLVFYYR